jgi:hypothetical protein
MEYLQAEWGYDKYPGVCHIIPNAGVCAMSLLYGEGRFDRTVEIATMAGWDTDCNAGNPLWASPVDFQDFQLNTVIQSTISSFVPESPVI